MEYKFREKFKKGNRTLYIEPNLVMCLGSYRSPMLANGSSRSTGGRFCTRHQELVGVLLVLQGSLVSEVPVLVLVLLQCTGRCWYDLWS
jgi:hypothetical protein